MIVLFYMLWKVGRYGASENLDLTKLGGLDWRKNYHDLHSLKVTYMYNRKRQGCAIVHFSLALAGKPTLNGI